MNEKELLKNYDIVDVDQELNTLSNWRIINVNDPSKFVDTIINTRVYIDIDNYEFYVDHNDQIRIRFGGNIYKTGVYMSKIRNIEGE